MRSLTDGTSPLTFTLLLGLLSISRAGAVTFSASSFYGTNGANPDAGLTLASNGNFYGTTAAGGLYGQGTVFMATHAGALTSLVSFDGTNGAQPLATLTMGTDGNFYGTASSGGDSGNGTFFKVTPAGLLTRLASFDGTNGAQPSGPLVQAPNGSFYGTASAGGSHGLGTLFVAGSSGITNLASFSGTNGGQPLGSLVLVRNGGGSITLYGTTAVGGAYNSGTIFSLTPNRALSLLYSFTGAGDGADPVSGLLLGADGNYYGTTASGINIQGTVFLYSPIDNTVTNVLTFGGTNGAQPLAPLVQGSDTNFYGTTFTGGAYGRGTVFRLNPDGTFTNLYSFQGLGDGSSPYFAGLTQGTNGNYYGVASGGGKSGKGTFYEVSGFPPYIINPPAGNTYAAGSTVTLRVSAGGSTPLSYFWRRNASPLADGGLVSGSSTATLTISNVTSAYAGAYTVFVRNSAGLVSNATAVVQVVNPPIVTITSPGRNAVIKTANISVTGTALSNLPVGSVHWQLNGGGWQLATPVTGWSLWAASMTLSPGSNTFQVYALNSLNRPSLTNSLNLIYSIGSAPVTVQVLSGKGVVSPVRDGQRLDISRTYTITATPAAGYVLSNLAVSGPSGIVASTDISSVTFAMESNLVIQASFVASPFTPVSGSYHGLFYVTNQVAATNSGLLAMTVVPGGTFSGYLQIGASRYPMSGRFHLDGSALATVIRPGLNPLAVTLQLDFGGGEHTVTGTVSSAAWTAQLDGDQAVFNGNTRKAPQAGRYTMSFLGGSNPAAEPSGDGYGIVTITPAGWVILAGTLADGTKISQSVPVSTNGFWPAYVSLYGGQGSLIGWIALSNAPPENLSGEIGWIKPPLKTKYYPAGFAFLTTVTGSRYGEPEAGTNVLNLANARLTLSDGNLSSSTTNQLAFDPNNRVINVSGPNLTLAIAPATGFFRGSVTPPGGTPAVFSGVLLQDQQIGRGFFLGTNQSGSVFLGE